MTKKEQREILEQIDCAGENEYIEYEKKLEGISKYHEGYKQATEDIHKSIRNRKVEE